nr:MAG TPA: hypothetical protein [Caudoviricetes sp.]
MGDKRAVMVRFCYTVCEDSGLSSIIQKPCIA